MAELFWSPEADENEPMGRVASSGTLEKHFVWFVGERMLPLAAPELDSVRLFSDQQKQELWAAADGKCGICGEYINPTYVEYDHIKPWILGGRTSVDNGRPVHPHCHARGLAAVDGTTLPAKEESK